MENLRKIDQNQKSIWVRIPLIPGLTDIEENLIQIAEFVSTLKNVERISLLPYNNAAGAKYEFIGKKYELEYISITGKKEEKPLLEIFSRSGIEVEIGR